MSYTLYTYPNNPRAFKSLVTASYAGISIDVPSFEMATIKTSEYLARFPAGQVPAMDTPDGPIWESDAIAKYIARKGSVLYGSSLYETSLIDSWIDWFNSKLSTPFQVWIYPIFGYLPFNAQATETAKQDVKKALSTLNNHLLKHTFIVGESITLADIIIASNLLLPYRQVFSPEYRKAFSSVTRWFRTIINQPKYLAIAGPIALAETMKAAEPSVTTSAGTLVSQPEKPVQPAKKTNPLDLLPPTKLDLETWKRVYSNNKETPSVAIDWFWDHYEESGWSIWFADYLENDTLTHLFMTSNLVRGFIQRLEAARRYAFAVINIFGEDNKSQIASCFLVRGTELPAEFSPEYVDDVETYSWVKADIHNEQHKSLIEAFFSHGQKDECFKAKYYSPLSETFALK